jgi:hypothetical protein
MFVHLPDLLTTDDTKFAKSARFKSLVSKAAEVAGAGVSASEVAQGVLAHIVGSKCVSVLGSALVSQSVKSKVPRDTTRTPQGDTTK